MNVYITKINGMGNTMQALQAMTAEIGHQIGFREMGVYYYNVKGESPSQRSVRFDGIIAGMQAGDIVICQFHTWNGLQFEQSLVQHIKAYHGRIVIFIHSLEALMIRGSRFMLRETVELYNQAEALIVPSGAMKKFLLDLGIRAGMKFIIQEMWDWTTDLSFREKPAFKKELCFPGATPQLLQDWKYGIPLKGNLPSNPEELLVELSKGGFGLEWYSSEQEYEYMQYGNPFWLNRYLAAGIPVIVPSGVSCQKLIEENHLGLVVNSLDEAVKVVESMSEAEYREYAENVERFVPAIRNGYYTRKCLTEAVCALFREDVGKAFTPSTDIYDLGECEFTSASTRETYGGKLALSWDMKGRRDGFLIYDSSGRLIEETENMQHYFTVKEYGKEERFVIRAYVNTQKGKMVVAKTETVYQDGGQAGKRIISLIMPVYNAEDYIARTVDTVLAQTFPDTEIVLVDDGSTDHTSEILDWYAGRYPNVVVVHQENGGVPAARNTGIERAGGEYIAFMDNDDMLRPGMLERLYDSIRKNDCDIAMTSIYEIVNGKYDMAMQHSVEEDVAVPIEEFLREYARIGYALCYIWNKLYRASLVKEHRFPLIVLDDEAWTPYVLSYAERVCYLDGGLYEYDRSIRPGTLVDKWFQKSKEDIFAAHEKAILFYLEHGNPEKRELLKNFAKSELGLLSRTTGYGAYRELWGQIEGTE